MPVGAARRMRRLLTRPADLALAAEAAAWLVLAWLALELLPFRRVAALLRPEPRPAGRPADLARLRWAIKAVSRRLPCRIVCFHRGIAAQRMLCGRGVAADLHYGVMRLADGSLGAHVWVTAEGEAVIGGEEAEACTLLTTFPARRSKI